MIVGSNYYDIIGVSKSASQEEIQKVFRKLAREYHPDVNKKAGSEDKFKEICKAYEVLKDPKKRKKYDRFGSDWERVEQASHAGGSSPYNNFSGGDFGNIDDIFSSIFGGGGKGFGGFNTPFSKREQSYRGQDKEVKIDITLEEALHGGSKNILLEGGGKRSIQIKIPKGVPEGTRIRLLGHGMSGVNNGQPGDLFLRVHILEHPIFKLTGHDFDVDVFASPWELALGTQLTVPTFEGPVKITIPPGTQGGQKLRLSEKGFPGKNARRGSLIVHIRAAIPKTLSAVERELFEELAKVSKFKPRGKE